MLAKSYLRAARPYILAVFEKSMNAGTRFRVSPYKSAKPWRVRKRFRFPRQMPGIIPLWVRTKTSSSTLPLNRSTFARKSLQLRQRLDMELSIPARQIGEGSSRNSAEMEANAPYMNNRGLRISRKSLGLPMPSDLGRPHSIEQEPDILEFRTCRNIFQSNLSVHDDASQDPAHSTSAIHPPPAHRDYDRGQTSRSRLWGPRVGLTAVLSRS
jgi:hypothetical protein